MANPKINYDGILMLEQPFAKVPYETLRRAFRSSQKHVEREFGGLQGSLSDMERRLKGGAGSEVKASGGGNGEAGEDVMMATAPVADTALSGDGPLETSAGSMTKEEASKVLEGMIGRMRGLKRKLSTTNATTTSALSQSSLRLSHLQRLYDMDSTSSPEFEEWSRTRLDRMMCDYMLRKGWAGAAETLKREKGIEPFADIELFAEIKRIEDSLAARSCTACLAWCSENKSTLRKMKSTLEFDLRLQEFIELTRKRDELQTAIAYVRKHLISSWSGPPTGEEQDAVAKENSARMKEDMQRAMGLLAFGPNCGIVTYEQMYDPSRWTSLISTFRSAALSLHSLPPQPILAIALSAGLSSLKVPACYPNNKTTSTNSSDPAATTSPEALGPTASTLNSLLAPSGLLPGSPAPSRESRAQSPFGSSHSPFPHPSSQSFPTVPISASAEVGSGLPKPSVVHKDKNIDCPVCDENGLGLLAEEVPWSHHVNSTIVCRITGKVMDADNQPMALPNGRVYSREALEDMALRNNGRITCPRTGESFHFAESRKVYIS